MWLKRDEFNKDDPEVFIGVQCTKSASAYTLRV